MGHFHDRSAFAVKNPASTHVPSTRKCAFAGAKPKLLTARSVSGPMKKKQADRTTKVFRRRLYLRHDSAKSVCGAGAILARAASTVYLERREGQAWGEHNRSAGREERTMIKTPAASAEKGICTGRAAPNGSKLRRFSNKANGGCPTVIYRVRRMAPIGGRRYGERAHAFCPSF